MIKVESNCSDRMTEEEMLAEEGQGIEYLAVNFLSEDTTYDDIVRFQKKAAKYRLTVADAGCPRLQKCPSIELGKNDRDAWIAKFNAFTEALGAAGIPYNYLAWQPAGIFRTKTGTGSFNRGQKSFICDIDEIRSREAACGRIYEREEIMDAFRYFLDKALPVCEKSGVALVLHPNDPPLESVCGIPSLIYNSDCYREAFREAGDSPYLLMKMCIGCYLENPAFGDLVSDIREFTAAGKLPIIHFRNVSGSLPYFEETLLEDGYADMYRIMKAIVSAGFDGYLNIDHAFFRQDGRGMDGRSVSYFTGYMKGLLRAALSEA